MTHELVVDVAADALLIDGESLHGELHPIERRRLPDKVGRKVVSAVGRHAVVPAELESDLVGDVCRKLISTQRALKVPPASWHEK